MTKERNGVVILRPNQIAVFEDWQVPCEEPEDANLVKPHPKTTKNGKTKAARPRKKKPVRQKKS